MPTPAKGRATFSAALERYRVRIERQVRAMVRDPGEGEDLVQQTMLRAHEQLPDLRDPRALGAWLRRIAARVCCDHLRRARLAPAGEQLEEGAGRPEELVPAGGPDAEYLADSAAMSACGAKLLCTLPSGYRAVLLMHDLRGLTGVEIAKLLGLTPGAVKIRLHRARQRFREALERECHMYHDDRGVLRGCPKPRHGRPAGAIRDRRARP